MLFLQILCIEKVIVASYYIREGNCKNVNICKLSTKNDFKYETTKEIIEYINEHLSEELSLDDVAKHFYLSVEYLCRLFKRNTGLTVNQYIAYKRVMLTKELHLKGIPLTSACAKAGFGDYSTFYRAYKKIMNEPPGKSLS